MCWKMQNGKKMEIFVPNMHVDSEHIFKNRIKSWREFKYDRALHWKTSVEATHQKIQKAII